MTLSGNNLGSSGLRRKVVVQAGQAALEHFVKDLTKYMHVNEQLIFLSGGVSVQDLKL